MRPHLLCISQEKGAWDARAENGLGTRISEEVKSTLEISTPGRGDYYCKGSTGILPSAVTEDAYLWSELGFLWTVHWWGPNSYEKKKRKKNLWHLLKKPLMRNCSELTKLKPLPMKGSHQNLLLWARYNVKVRKHLPSSHMSQSLKILTELAAWKPCKQHWVYTLKMPSKHTSLDQTSTALIAHLENKKK